MTQEDKQLLLQDLCARLLYGVQVCYKIHLEDEPIDVTLSGLLLDYFNNKTVAKIKPYLRPMSSMTEEEALKLWDLLYSSYRRNKILEIIIKQECIDYILDDGVASTETFSIYYDNVVRTIDTFDWLNSHHFDYRGLIEKGLALEAPEGMYNI